jgi:hypothetical protein
MDGERFDALSRALGSGATRRGVVGLLAGLLGLRVKAATARDGAAGGLLGGRHSKHRRRHKDRDKRKIKSRRLDDLPKCSSRPDYYRERFQYCFNSGEFNGRQATCSYCAQWMSCGGSLDTQTSCGTVNAGDPNSPSPPPPPPILICQNPPCYECAPRADYYRERFQLCFNSVEFNGRKPTCGYCAQWMSCGGPIDTQTACGTIHVPFGPFPCDFNPPRTKPICGSQRCCGGIYCADRCV